MKSKLVLYSELILLFFILPCSFLINYPNWIKVISAVIGFGYIIYYLFKTKSFQFKTERRFFLDFWKTVLIRFTVIVILMTMFTYYFYNDKFFSVLLERPKLWLFILFVYSFISVPFQELIYRSFFFNRYQDLFENNKMLICINAIVFALAHIFLKSTLVLVLTFVGGILFALTFLKTKSTTLVCIEHALYGFWLFTVGLGEMLAFPGANTEF